MFFLEDVKLAFEESITLEALNLCLVVLGYLFQLGFVCLIREFMLML